MNINRNSQINFTYQPLKAVKKPSLFSKIVEPIRASLGASVWKSLGKLHLSQEAKNTIGNKRDDFLSDENGKRLTIAINNPKGKKTHQLDGIAISPSQKNERKYMVVFFGLRDCYENHLTSMKKLAEDTNTTVVSINYRGTLDSSGTPNGIHDYITDGKALIEYLTKSEGADPKDILLYGHSLGGGVAAKVYQELNHPGPILSESSFSNFKKAVKDKKGSFTAWLIKKTGWNINSVKALENIQPGQLGIIVNRRDSTVNYQDVSLYKALKKASRDHEFPIIKIGKKPAKDTHGEIQKNIKKTGWIEFLRHPHQMLMDQPLPGDIRMPHKLQNELERCPEKEALANELVELNKKYAEEDKLAYEGMINMIKTMLQVT